MARLISYNTLVTFGQDVNTLRGGNMAPPWVGRDQLEMAGSQHSLRNYLIFWLGQALSLLGSHLVQFGLIWWLTRETGSATVLAGASLIGLVPQVILGPFIGTLVDRWPRKAIMLAADGSIALATVLLVFAFARGFDSLALVYALLLVRALGGAFHQPAMLASTSLMVPPEQLTRMQGLNQTLQGGLNIISAPLGAFLLELLDVQGILMIDIVTAIIAIGILIFITIPQPKQEIEEDELAAVSSFLRQIGDGFRYIRGWTGLLMVIVMVALINMVFVPAGSLQPLLVKEYFGGGALELGWLQSGFGLGVLIGGALLSVWGGFKRRIVTSLVSLVGLGLAFGAIGLVPADKLVWAIVATFFMGFMLPLVNGPFIAVLQATVAEAMQGRVIALTTSLATAMAPLGLIIAGPLADWLAVQVWYVVGGVVSVVMGLAGLALPPVLHIEDRTDLTIDPAQAVGVEPVMGPQD